MHAYSLLFRCRRRAPEKMELRHGLAALAVFFALAVAEAGAESIAGAGYATPVERYGHFALGRPHEYARLTVTTDRGRKLVFFGQRKKAKIRGLGIRGAHSTSAKCLPPVDAPVSNTTESGSCFPESR